MDKGPKFNNIKRDFSRRNSMGFDEVINSLQDQNFPIITNETGHVFYFAFIVWSANDYIRETSYENRTKSGMDEYFKIQNFFFSTSFLLKDYYLRGASGSINIRNYIKSNDTDQFVFDDKYILTLQDTMGYYRPGLSKLLLLETKTSNGDDLKCPQITSYGKEFADAFESVIKDTMYFKEYRNKKIVPRRVLEELGDTINLNLKNIPIIQKKLAEVLFYNKYNSVFLKNLTFEKDYLLYTIKNYKSNLDDNIREVLFDYYSPRSLNYKIADELINISKIWEIIIGRQYFTIGLSMIWKHMLYLLDEPMTEKQWMSVIRKKALENIDLDDSLESIRIKSNFSYEERESMIKAGIEEINSNLLVDGMKIMLSIYNRFNKRDDIGMNYSTLFGSGDSIDTVPLKYFFDSVEVNKQNKAIDFLELVSLRLILQNKIAGYKKIQRGKNGHYYEYINGYYYRIMNYSYDYAEYRIVNVLKALYDLDLLGDDTNE